MKPSRLVPIKTDAVIGDSLTCGRLTQIRPTYIKSV